MTKHDDGGPISPLPVYAEVVFPNGQKIPMAVAHEGGMSLRDFFAAQAIAGSAKHESCQPDANGMAKRAYALADAMLAARSPTGSAS